MNRRQFILGSAAAVGAAGTPRAVFAAGSKVRGWVDLQVNGRVGVSFTDRELTPERVLKAVEALRAGGTEGFLATITTCPDEMAVHALRTLRAAMKKYAVCERTILGFHMEGPFVSNVPGYSGAHNRQWTRDPDFAVYEKWQDAADGLVKIVTLDGDRKGAEDFIRRITAAGTVASLGHTTTYRTEDLDRLARAGAKTCTHLGNALPNLLPRHGNLIWNALANPHYTPMFIADGFHLPREVLHGYVRMHPLETLIAVSDCSYPGGLKPGRYEHNGSVSVLEASGFLRSPMTNSLHGSSCLMADCVRVLNSPEVGLSLADCVRLCRENPLRLIGLEGWGA